MGGMLKEEAWPPLERAAMFVCREATERSREKTLTGQCFYASNLISEKTTERSPFYTHPSLYDNNRMQKATHCQ